MMIEQIKIFRLSILLVTYDHEQHIRKALTGLFRQIIEGPIELLIADDGSSDNTLEIIRECDGKDPRFVFKYIGGTTNVGITKNYQRGFDACAGEYVAVLEGDDYWVSPFKLQRQRDFLDFHWECDLCSVNYFVYEEGRCQFTPRVPIGYGHRFIGARDLIQDNLVGNFSTCMYRRAALESLPTQLFELRSYDWIVNICVARKSLIGFLEEPLSVYRLHSAGAWTQTPKIEKLKVQLDLIPAYDELTGHVFHEEFAKLANRIREVISTTRIEKAVAYVAQPVAKALPRIMDYTPPILLAIGRLMLPPKLKRFLARKFLRS